MDIYTDPTLVVARTPEAVPAMRSDLAGHHTSIAPFAAQTPAVLTSDSGSWTAPAGRRHTNCAAKQTAPPRDLR